MENKVRRMPKTNTEMKNNNLKRIFFEIQASAPIQRRELEKVLGLSWGNISLNIGLLLNLGLLRETADDSAAVGRRPQSLDINSFDHFLIGLDVKNSLIHAVLCDMRGRVVYQYYHVVAYNDKDFVLQEIYVTIDHILREAPNKTIVGIGIAAQGIVNKRNTTSILFPGFKNWEKVNLKELMEERYGITTFVFHDPDAMMCAEKLFRIAKEPGLKNVALVRLDEGVGLSIMIGGEIFTSMTGKSGEIGHINIERDGLPCSCGDRGCLEPYVTETGLIARFQDERGSGVPTSVALQEDGSVTIHELAAAAKNGDPLCCRLFEEMGTYLGIGISAYINMLNPQLILLEGGSMRYSSLFETAMRASVGRHVWKFVETRIVVAEPNPFLAAIGAALASLEKAVISTPDFLKLFVKRENIKNA